MSGTQARMAEFLRASQSEVLTEWSRTAAAGAGGRIPPDQLRREQADIVALVSRDIAGGDESARCGSERVGGVRGGLIQGVFVRRLSRYELVNGGDQHAHRGLRARHAAASHSYPSATGRQQIRNANPQGDRS